MKLNTTITLFILLGIALAAPTESQSLQARVNNEAPSTFTGHCESSSLKTCTITAYIPNSNIARIWLYDSFCNTRYEVGNLQVGTIDITRLFIKKSQSYLEHDIAITLYNNKSPVVVTYNGATNDNTACWPDQSGWVCMVNFPCVD